MKGSRLNARIAHAKLNGDPVVLPENLTNRPGDVRFKLFAIEQLRSQIVAIQNSMGRPDINGKLPGDYNE